ncbi:MAG: ABC transporter permease, partial [Candidatus Hodarchaeales archaeon]
ISLNQGTVLNPPILVGENLADNLGVSAGDNLLLVFAEGDFKVNISQQIDFVYKDEDKGREFFSFAIVTRLDILQLLVEPLSGSSTSINSIKINFKDNIDSKEKAEEALIDIEAATDVSVTNYDSTFFYYSNTKYNIKDAIANLIESLDQMLTIFGSLIVLAGLLLIVNIQLMSVEEREQQVGILRAVGTQRGQILGTVVIEVLLLGLIGSFLGIIGGILYGLFLVWAFAWTFEFPAQEVLVEYNFLGLPFRGPLVAETLVITSFIIGFLIALITSVLPAWRASRINIVEVMRGISPPESKGSGRKGLFFGIILIIIGGLWGISSGLEPWSGTGAWGNVDDAEVLYFIILLPVVGLALTASYFLSRRMSLNVMAFALVAWPVFNGFVVTDWLTEGSGGMLWIIGIIMGLIAGSCMLIGVNLDYVAVAIRKAAGVVPALKAISLVAMEQMATKKVRSTLVFAIFSVVLTMNIMLAIWSYSYRYGADETVELVSGGTDVIIVADQDVPNSFNFSELVKNKFANSHGVNLVRGYTVSPNPTPAFLDENDSYEDAHFVTIIPIDEKSFWRDGQFNYDGWAFQFSLDTRKADPLETAESVDNTKAETRQENEAVWRFVADNQTIEDKPVAIIPPFVASFTGDLAVEAGGSIWLLEKDGVTRREFVAAATDYGNALTNWPTALAA